MSKFTYVPNAKTAIARTCNRALFPRSGRLRISAANGKADPNDWLCMVTVTFWSLSNSAYGARAMPQNVIMFERLMYVSLCIGLISLSLSGPGQASSAEMEQIGGPIAFVAITVGMLGLFVLLIWLIARRGKDWARYVFMAMFVIGLVPTLQNIARLMDTDSTAAALSIGQTIIQAGALFLIFTGDAPPWFRKPDKAVAAAATNPPRRKAR